MAGSRLGVVTLAVATAGPEASPTGGAAREGHLDPREEVASRVAEAHLADTADLAEARLVDTAALAGILGHPVEADTRREAEVPGDPQELAVDRRDHLVIQTGRAVP